MFSIILDNYESAMEGTVASDSLITASSIEKALSMMNTKYKSEPLSTPDKWGAVTHKYTFNINGNKTHLSVNYDSSGDKKDVQTAITKAIQNFSKSHKTIIPELTKEFYDNDNEWVDKEKYSRENWVSKVTLNSIHVDTMIAKTSGNRITVVECYYELPSYGGHVAVVECKDGIFNPGKSHVSLNG